ncbi:MAG: cellulase family glycosylhydrolase, partial [Acidobacteriota bacterium]|nr:cellulase family glycosylhydrolase [Acidobacteriota bacterium]
KSIGLNVLRSPAFLDAPWRGAYFQSWNPATNCLQVNTGEDGLQRLDHLIAAAEQAEIRLILPLVNYWPDFGGMDQYVKWFHARSRNAFYRDPALRNAYQSYVSQILNRENTLTGRLYKDEPSILAWELANEPRCADAALLIDWVQQMSRWIKQNDPNHLLAVGDEGYLTKQFLVVPEIDFGTFHLYPEAWKKRDPVAFGLRWIEQHLAAGRSAGKPMLLEEYGITSKTSRNGIYTEWLRAIEEQDGAGDLAWMLASTDDETGEPYADHDGFTFYSGADVPSICEHVIRFRHAPTPPRDENASDRESS